MQSPTQTDTVREIPSPSGKSHVITNLNFDSPPKPITEFAGRPDFPQCAVGEHIDIGGFAGVLIEIVHNSIKVRSSEGITQSFNFLRLRMLYSPALRPEPVETSRTVEELDPPAESVVAPPLAPIAEAVETPPPISRRDAITRPNFDGTPKPIAEFAGRPDFPQCAFGEYVNIGGYAGVVMEIVNQSIKVRSPEGITQSFNFPRLRKLYGPTLRPEPVEISQPAEQPGSSAAPVETLAPATPREVIAKPNFGRDVKAIRVFASRPDFPECAYGQHVDIRGYAGVVVEIGSHSIKVRSSEGETRSFDATVLRKLYGRG
jgi:hypothetical protein